MFNRIYYICGSFAQVYPNHLQMITHNV